MAWIHAFICLTGLPLIGARSSETGSPLPETIHEVISLSDFQQGSHEDARNRSFSIAIIGDVHGCLTELRKVIQKLEQDYESSLHPLGGIVFVGDLVVKGPYSVETIRYIREVLMPKYKVYCVRGNHDDNALLAYHKIGKKYEHMKELRFVRNFTKPEIKWIQSWPITLLISPYLLIVHAGIRPGRNYDQTKFIDLITMRTVDARLKPNDENPDDKNKLVLWGSKHQSPPFVVFGHAAKQRLQLHKWAIGVDTASVYGGQLSALVINIDKDQQIIDRQSIMQASQIVSVQAEKAYDTDDN